MSLTLVGETLTFAHDSQLLGFCPDDPDEPAGDDFVTRKNNKLRGGAWVDPHIGFCTPQDLFDAENEEVEEEGELPNEEVRGVYARFCDMTEAEQTMFMYKVTMHVCSLVGVSVCDWEPSDEFVLDAIENELSDDNLKEMALTHFFDTSGSFEFRSTVGGSDFITDPDLIRVAQQSVRVRTLLNYDEEEAKESRSFRRGLSVNGRNRACFYSTRRALSIRRDHDTLFSEEVVQVGNDWEATFELIAIQDLEEMDVKTAVTLDPMYEEYTREDVRNERTPGVRDLYSFDPWALGGSSYYDFDEFDGDYSCGCSVCRGSLDDPMTAVLDDFSDRFGDQDDGDSFADYGPSDQEIDVIQFAHSSQLRLTSRHRRMIGMF